MANKLYPQFKKNVQKKLIDLETDTVMACLVDTAIYTYDAAHEFLSSISAVGSPAVDARVGTDQELTGKSISTAGVFDAGDPTFPSVSGDPVEAVVIYVAVGSPATYYLAAYIDTATGLPFTPSGGDETINWDNGANKIWAL